MRLKFQKPDFKNPRVRRSAIIIAVVAVAVLTTITSTALTLTSNNIFCSGACHFLMQYDVNAYEKSAHANVQCIACHIPSNMPDFAVHKVEALGELKDAVMGTYPWPINPKSELSTAIPNDNCDICHSIEKRKVTPTAGIIINHKVHLDKGIKCAYCHNRVAHPNLTVKVTDEQLAKLKEEAAKTAGAEGGKKGKSGEEGRRVNEVKVVNGQFSYINMISMEGCTRCHTQEANAKAPGKCSTCHTAGFDLKPKGHEQYSWLHPVNGQRAAHSREAKANLQYCKECHAQKFCQDCHGLETMPHPESFKVAVNGRAQHAEIGQANPQVCRKCHTQENFCTACHHKDGYSATTPWVGAKGTPMAHPGVVKTKGAETCFKCHDERFCSSCHTQGQPDMNFLSRRR
ncbi:MAG: NapC/NirT family cytochrome c [Chloroflexi bacterium]|nr:NapC/NirT family cytochrome c [Chloroflexota bacterium]